MKLIARPLCLIATLSLVPASPAVSVDFAQAAVAPGQVPAPAPAAPAAPAAPGVVPPRPTTPAAQQAKPEEQLRIVADPATNSLIIYSTVQEFQNIKTILKDLDQIPRQVLLDVLVAEVTLTDNQKLGVDYEVLARNPASIFGQRFPSAGAVRTLGDLFPIRPETGNSAFGGGISGVFGGKDIKAFVNALQSDTRFKVLSSPSILATDNRPARIQVGTEEPIATGTTTAQVGTPASSTSIQYRNTGRIVTIIPQVNSQGLVNLQILAEVSQRRERNVAIGADTFPAFDTRQAETTAVVQDGDTLVIGGIITDNRNRTRSGIPYLMDLPVVGRFFSTTSDESERTELIMLITPHVVRNRDDSQQVTESFKNSLGIIRNELERMTREKEKLLQNAPPPLPQPAAPGPSGDQPPAPNLPQTAPSPAPAPSAAPAPPNASNAPMKPILFGPNGSPIAADAEDLPFQPRSPQREAYEANASRQNSVASSAAPAPIVALVKAEPTGKIPVKGTLPKPQTGPLWSVQVASFAQRKDAEALAASLRALGYDAFTQEAEVAARQWHRVRVGKTSNQKDAFELQKTLRANNKFEQAFVTR